ncbi:MAG: chemotaxis protein, partial [Kamptonema sp. SIO1D9]|nr:chemotaxis protein [Kamptonema sp. SIO1D9]
DIQNAINSTVMVTDEGTKTVETGVEIARQTADAFAGVADAVNNMVLSNQQILLNIRQQAGAIEQVWQTTNDINQGAKETATGISQTKFGTERLNQIALALKEMI